MNCPICSLKWHRPEQHTLPQAPAQETCCWVEDIDASWDTACGGKYSFIDGTPTDNKMAFCCYCGKPLKEGRDE